MPSTANRRPNTRLPRGCHLPYRKGSDRPESRGTGAGRNDHRASSLGTPGNARSMIVSVILESGFPVSRHPVASRRQTVCSESRCSASVAVASEFLAHGVASGFTPARPPFIQQSLRPARSTATILARRTPFATRAAAGRPRQEAFSSVPKAVHPEPLPTDRPYLKAYLAHAS
jgi:hypothetical protein